MADPEHHMGFHLTQHPVLMHKLAALRSKDTSPKVFRELMREVTFYLGYEATSHINVKEIEVETPVARTKGNHIAERIAIVPIMRAGLQMVDPMLELLPNSSVHHIGMYRDSRTLCPILYYNKLPAECNADVTFVLDPMIATSGTINATIGIVKEWGCKNIVIMTVIASRSGIESLLATHPDVRVHVAAIDDELTEDGLISPGLGDAGNRMFGTPETPGDEVKSGSA